MVKKILPEADEIVTRCTELSSSGRVQHQCTTCKKKFNEQFLAYLHVKNRHKHLCHLVPKCEFGLQWLGGLLKPQTEDKFKKQQKKASASGSPQKPKANLKVDVRSSGKMTAVSKSTFTKQNANIADWCDKSATGEHFNMAKLTRAAKEVDLAAHSDSDEPIVFKKSGAHPGGRGADAQKFMIKRGAAKKLTRKALNNLPDAREHVQVEDSLFSFFGACD